MHGSVLSGKHRGKPVISLLGPGVPGAMPHKYDGLPLFSFRWNHGEYSPDAVPHVLFRRQERCSDAYGNAAFSGHGSGQFFHLGIFRGRHYLKRLGCYGTETLENKALQRLGDGIRFGAHLTG